MEKRNCYQGYKEYYMTGEEIKQYFIDCYECFGKHHSKISTSKIDFKKRYKKIENNKIYRLFINDNFCKIMDGETDDSLFFFGYTK